MNFLDLFSGAGGLSLGFLKAGFSPIMAIEKDPSACKTYTENIDENCLQDDLTEMTPRELDATPKIIIGGPPCQDFSVANYYSRGGEKTNLVFVFLDWVKFFKPRFFVMENVPGIKTVDNIFQKLVTEYEKMGYNVSYKECNSVDFGVPQKRKRVFLVGSLNKRYSFPEVNRRTVSVEEAFYGLPKLSSGETSDIFHNHTAPDHTRKMVERFSEINQGESVYETWSEKIRLKSDAPSPTLKAGKRANFHFVHPYDDRGLTVRERARLQSFPDSFRFYGSITEQRKQVGNAVPPEMARIIAENIKTANDKTSVFDY